MQPFSISLFATTGDPEGIRHVDKSNWSGTGVVFPRSAVNALKAEPGSSQAAVYILVGNASEETIYIGEADPVGDRLKNHVANKQGWVWGVYFFDRNHKIGKTEVQYLESALVSLAKKHGRAILLNKNNPAEPTMSAPAKATAQAFLADMLLILPMLGINAFSSPRNDEPKDTSPQVEDGDSFDTIVVPARGEGFAEVFLNEHCWYAVRINSKHLGRIRYIAAYQVAPIAAITHVAAIKEIIPYQDTGKYLIRFTGAPTAIEPIKRSADSTVNMQSSRYALIERIANSENLDDVWSGKALPARRYVKAQSDETYQADYTGLLF